MGRRRFNAVLKETWQEKLSTFAVEPRQSFHGDPLKPQQSNKPVMGKILRATQEPAPYRRRSSPLSSSEVSSACRNCRAKIGDNQSGFCDPSFTLAIKGTGLKIPTKGLDGWLQKRKRDIRSVRSRHAKKLSEPASYNTRANAWDGRTPEEVLSGKYCWRKWVDHPPKKSIGSQSGIATENDAKRA